MTDREIEFSKQAALEDALKEYISEMDPNHMLTGYFIVASTAMLDTQKKSGYWYVVDDNALHNAIGLSEMGRAWLQDRVEREDD